MTNEAIQQLTMDCGCEFIIDTHISLRIVSHSFCSKHTSQLFIKKDAD